MSSKVVTLTTENFDTIALAADRTAVVDFWAAWCPPCRALAPAVEALAEERPDVLVGKLNVDEYPQIAERYGIVGIPTVLAFRAGALVGQSVGLVPVARLRDLLPASEDKAAATTA